jgi:hypothetical protein
MASATPPKPPKPREDTTKDAKASVPAPARPQSDPRTIFNDFASI